MLRDPVVARRRLKELRAGGTAAVLIATDGFPSLADAEWWIVAGCFERRRLALRAAGALGGRHPGARAVYVAAGLA